MRIRIYRSIWKCIPYDHCDYVKENVGNGFHIHILQQYNFLSVCATLTSRRSMYLILTVYHMLMWLHTLELLLMKN